MNNEWTVWSGSLVPLKASQGDDTSESVTLYLIPESGAVITHDANYETIDGGVVADLTFTAPNVAVNTVYSYYVTENFQTGAPLIYPDPQNCSDEDCELPTLTVCPLEEETS